MFFLQIFLERFDFLTDIKAPIRDKGVNETHISVSSSLLLNSNIVVPSLYMFCADTVVREWDHKESRSILAQEIKKLPPALVEELVRAFVRSKKLTDTVLWQLLPGVRNYLFLPDCTSLRKATIRKIPFYCEHLRYLDLSGCKQVTNTIVHHILQNCGDLVSLNLSSCIHLSDYAFLTVSSPFDALIGLYNLESINLSNCCQITGSCIISILKLSMHLDTINLEGCRSITKNAIEKLLSYPFLSSINISGIPSITDSSIQMLGDNDFHFQLTELYLSNLNISESTLCSVLSKIPTLKVLHIGYYTNITDSMLIRIVENCPDLIELNLNNCGFITDRGIRYLLSHLQLKSLDISFCTQVTFAAFKGESQCRKTLQKLRIIWCPQLVGSLQDIHEYFVNLQQISIKGCGCSASVVDSITHRGIKVTS